MNKILFLLLLVLGCEPVSNNNPPENFPRDWKVIETINSNYYYVKDTKKNLCFVWENQLHSGHGPNAYVPCDKLENENNPQNKE
jgi:hypothetical protein